MQPAVSVYELAAFAIDFEGSIDFSRSRNKCGNFAYAKHVRIQNVAKTLLQEFATRVGFGIVRPNPSDNAKGAPIYSWYLAATDIRETLPKIEPYLRLKRQQARLLIEASLIIKPADYMYRLNNTQRAAMYNQEELVRLDVIFDEMKELNESPARKIVLTPQQLLLKQLKVRGV